MRASEKFDQWLEMTEQGSSLHDELLSMKDSPTDIDDRFGTEISFGTAGLRGVVGAGTNAMNEYTVGRTVKGLSDYLSEVFQEKSFRDNKDAPSLSAVIAFDPRHGSREFSVLAAQILAAAGITVYTFDGIRPTPELAFLIRQLHAACGINITASHNPKEYNGCKIYWSDGCQISGSVSDAIAERINTLSFFSPFEKMPFEDGVKAGKIILLGEKEDRLYLDMIKSLSVFSSEDELDLSIPIVYTPLNGAGSIPFSRIMAERGFSNFHIVEEQKEPDPDFTTVGYPNPEDPKAFALAEKLGKELSADVLLATDPDSDRFAIEIRKDDGTYLPLNGNQTGYLLLDYILSGRKRTDSFEKKPAAVRSIVTSPLGDVIAAHYGVTMFESLTGFKNICGTIPVMQENGFSYVFGWEESVGYAACPDIRDKDGISAGMLVAECAAHCRKAGKSLFTYLTEIYEKFGFYAEDEPFIIHKGLSGQKEIAEMMARLRNEPFTNVAGTDVSNVIDYENGCPRTLSDGTENPIPPSNVIRYDLSNGSRFFVRPSGTEPKIKFYFYSTGESIEAAHRVNAAIKKDVLRFFGECPQ